MISVSDEQLTTVEYLLNQSAQGNHVLFDLDLVREVFALNTPMTEEDAYEVEHHIEKLLSQEGVGQQRAYLDQLPKEVLFSVIKTYFNIVENNLFENHKVIQ